MKRYEKVAAVLMTAGFVLALFLAVCSDADSIANTLMYPWLFMAAALMAGAIFVAKRGWEKDTGKKAMLFFDLSKEARK